MSFKKLISNHKLYFALLIIFLPTQLAYHFWPDYTRVFGLRIDYLSPIIYLTDILFLLFFAIWIISMFQERATSKKIKVTPLIFFITLFAILNISFSTLPLNAFYHWLRFVQLLFLAWYVNNHQQIVWKILKTILPYQLVFISALVIAQFYLQSSIGGPFWWLGERTFDISTPGIAKTEICNWVITNLKLEIKNCQLFLRPYSTFSHPNSLAGYLLIGLILTAYLNKNRPSIIRYSLFPIPIIALVLTFSRTAWLALVVIASISFFLKLFRKQKANMKQDGSRNTLVFLVKSTFWVLVFTSILFPFSLYIFPYSLPQNLQIRVDLFHHAWQLIQNRPLLGFGLGNFIPAVAPYLDFPVSALLQPVHNIFWLILSETGVVGLILTLLVIKKLLNSRPNILSSKDKSLILASILITGMTDHYWLTLYQNRLLLAITVGLIL
jgi:hypothetical protein